MKVTRILLLLVLGLLLAGRVAQRMSDGPTGPIQGGALRAGPLVSESEVDWSAALGDAPVGSIELQLVEPPRSRITGAFVYEGQLFVPCDLGFIWRRAPDTSSRWLLRVIWLLKGWHEDVLRDGRVVLRVDGKRYQRFAVRVTDAELLATFRGHVEDAAEQYLGSLLPEEPDPEAIWFFRMDPRPMGLQRSP
jgi:hypothetical protein